MLACLALYGSKSVVILWKKHWFSRTIEFLRKRIEKGKPMFIEYLPHAR
jgi:hypothetical protein